MSLVKLIKGMRKNTRLRYEIESSIERLKDKDEKNFFINLYNEKLKVLGINDKYEKVPFEE